MKKTTREEFTARHKALAEKIAEIKATLKMLKKQISPIARTAKMLKTWGNDLYVVGPKKETTPSFKRLPKMMDDLDIWSDLDDDFRLWISTL